MLLLTSASGANGNGGAVLAFERHGKPLCRRL
jgi:hypothetical protein